jgi:hypothetical protein
MLKKSSIIENNSNNKKIIKVIAYYSFTLNFIWEMLQMSFYKNMYWDLQSTLYCFAASLGDIFMTLIIFFTVGFLVKDMMWITNLNFKKIIFSLFTGLIIALIVEHIALVLNLWSYSDLMPKISFGNIGVVPILQMLVLPLLVFKLTALKVNSTNKK